MSWRLLPGLIMCLRQRTPNFLNMMTLSSSRAIRLAIIQRKFPKILKGEIKKVKIPISKEGLKALQARDPKKEAPEGVWLPSFPARNPCVADRKRAGHDGFKASQH